MIPLSCVLRKMKAGYIFGKNNLLFMDGHKLFSKNEKKIKRLVSTVNGASK